MESRAGTGEAQQNIADKKLKSENRLCQMYSEGPKSSNKTKLALALALSFDLIDLLIVSS